MIAPVDVAAFQRLHVGPDGVQLLPDGVPGPRTQWALDIEALPIWRSTLVLTGLRWRGHAETGENRGPAIDAWNTAAGAPLGSPWCASFASMCIRAAGFECREASVHRLAEMYPETETPLPGDLCILRRPNGTGHVDIVTGLGLGLVSVVGGNVGNQVQAGIRSRAGRTFHRVGPDGMPQALLALPSLGAQDR